MTMEPTATRARTQGDKRQPFRPQRNARFERAARIDGRAAAAHGRARSCVPRSRAAHHRPRARDGGPSLFDESGGNDPCVLGTFVQIRTVAAATNFGSGHSTKLERCASRSCENANSIRINFSRGKPYRSQSTTTRSQDFDHC